MRKLIPGRIVYPSIPIPDPQGKNPKPGRPFIVISQQDEITAGGRVTIVGITSTFAKPLAPDFVKLQWGHQSQSKLRSESVAHCQWVFTIQLDHLGALGGIIQSRELVEIRQRAPAPIGDLGASKTGNESASTT